MEAAGAVLTALLFAAPAWADWFDDFDGSFDQFWAFQGLDDSGTLATINGTVQDDTLLMTDLRPAIGGGRAFGFGFVPQDFVDLSIGVEVNPLGEDAAETSAGGLGVLARGNLLTLESYVFTVVYLDNGEPNLTNQLQLTHFTGPETSTVLAQAALPEFSTVSSYYLQLTVVGTQLTAQVFDSRGGAELARMTVVDGSLSAGVAGVAATADALTDEGENEVSLWSRFDNVAATAVVVSLPGDFDGDGDVDGDDLSNGASAWEARFGADLGGPQLLQWQRSITSAGAASIPEPSTLTLLITATLAGLMPRGSRTATQCKASRSERPWLLRLNADHRVAAALILFEQFESAEKICQRKLAIRTRADRPLS